MREFTQDIGGRGKHPLVCKQQYKDTNGTAREQLTRALTRARFIAHPVSMGVDTFTLGGTARTALIFGDQHTKVSDEVDYMGSTCDDASTSEKLQAFVGLITCNARACVDVFWEFPYFGYTQNDYDERVDAHFGGSIAYSDLMLVRVGEAFAPCFNPDRDIPACRRLGNARFHSVDYRTTEVIDAFVAPMHRDLSDGRAAELMLTRSPLHMVYFVLTLLGVVIPEMRASMETMHEMRTGKTEPGAHLPFKKQIDKITRRGTDEFGLIVRINGRVSCRLHPTAELATAEADFVVKTLGVKAADIAWGVFVFDKDGVLLSGKGSDSYPICDVRITVARAAFLMEENPFVLAYEEMCADVDALMQDDDLVCSRSIDEAQLKMLASYIFLPRRAEGNKHGTHMPSDELLKKTREKFERRRSAMDDTTWRAFTRAIVEELLGWLHLDRAKGQLSCWATYLRLLFSCTLDGKRAELVYLLRTSVTVGIGAFFMDMMSIPRLLMSDARVSITVAGYAHTQTLVRALANLGARRVHSSPPVPDPVTRMFKKCVSNMPVGYVPTFVNALMPDDRQECTLTRRQAFV